jgi:hypothetical protein
MSEKRNFESTQIFEGEYFPKTKVMHLTFRSGKKKYEYQDVPPEVWKGLCEAESHGRFFSQNIKQRYVYKRLEDAPAKTEGQGAAKSGDEGSELNDGASASQDTGD